MSKPKRMDLKSLSITEEQQSKLKQLFPEVFNEDKVDFDKLKRSLGEEIDEGEERFGMTWPGKNECFRVIQEPSVATLKPYKQESIDWDNTENLFIEGDNLEVLKLLQRAYYGKIKMIYIDPPYNTGNQFIYPDNYTESLETYLAYTGQVDAEGVKFSTNTEAEGRFHSKWMNMMYPRLFLAKNLLKDDGVIFISIDEHELINLRNLMNEIYGQENHVATITVINNMKGRNDKANVATCHEYLLIYSKGEFVSYGLPLSEEQLSKYKYIDENRERYALRDLRKRGRPDRREDRPNMYFPIYYNEKKNQCYLERLHKEDIEIFPKRGDKSDGRWRWGKDRVKVNLDILHPKHSKKKGRWDIEHRVYLNPNVRLETGDEEVDDDQEYQRTSKSKSFWWGGDISTDVANREFKSFFEGINPDYPKSPFFMEKLLHMATKPGDYVLDFFSGYSTTAVADLKLRKEKGSNRKFIMVQLPEPCDIDSDAYKAGYKTIADISKEQIRRVIKKIKKEHKTEKKEDKEKLFSEGNNKQLDLGFRVFKLDKSNFNIWDGTVDEDGDVSDQIGLFVDHIDPEVSDEDILYEILLKSGFELTTKIEELDMAGKKVYSIADNALLICLDRKLTKEVMTEMVRLQPARVVCLDAGFADNDQLKTNAVQIMKSHDVEDFRTV
ncbi:site-specific DNA-methyltransferase [Planctomycetota bacterium]